MEILKHITSCCYIMIYSRISHIISYIHVNLYNSNSNYYHNKMKRNDCDNIVFASIITDNHLLLNKIRAAF